MRVKWLEDENRRGCKGMRTVFSLALTLAILSSGQAYAESTPDKNAPAKTKSTSKSPDKKDSLKKADKPKIVIPEQKMPKGFKDALVYQSMNVYEKAIPLYLIALKEDPEFISTYNNLAQCYFKRNNKGDKKEAQKYLAQSLKLAPENVGSLHTKAIMAESDKKYEDAEDSYRKILKVQPLNFQAVQNLSELLFKIGKRKEAREVIVEVLKKDPPDEHKQVYEQALKNLDNEIKSKSKKKTG